MVNKLIVIGYIGIKKCYLNITEDQAIKRYCKTENITRQMFDEDDISIYTIEFNDEFCAYEVWE
jgi:hypothetical protein